MHVHAYGLTLLSLLLGCVRASRVRLADHKDSDEDLFIPGVVQPGSVTHQPVDDPRPPSTGRFALPVPPGSMGMSGNMSWVPNGQVAQELGTAFTDAFGEAAASLTLEACGAWLSATSPTTGLIFLIVFINEQMRERAVEMQREECVALLDGFRAEPGDFSAVDRDFLTAVKKGSSIDAWTPQPSDWVAFVARGESIKAVFSGDKTGLISKSEATEREPVKGAVSWGFSMLLHRLKLQGIEKATIANGSPLVGTDKDLLYFDLFKAKAELQALQDVQEAGSIDAWIEDVENQKAELAMGLEGPILENVYSNIRLPVEERQAQISKLNRELQIVANLDEFEIEAEIERLERAIKSLSKKIKGLPTQGARVYHPTMKPKNPYTYESVRVVKQGVIDHHAFDLTSESYGSEYGQAEPY